ncbi:uncharacterized protein LOC109725566 [Ananas comosus]|uniref:Uncharacterized protein LOC109725566 n=1 Tax=Ananas comosus TaxID=4615 RepID=A0A6P5GRF7_ANACO|nr:uncharacterized protein LOC109725566 [Ananas comosus]
MPALSADSRGQLSMLKDLLRGHRPSDRSDSIRWRWTSDQLFTVKSLYQLITDAGLRVSMNQHIWNLKIPVKIKVFIWLLLRKRLPTADILLIRGMHVNQNCAFCAILTESCDHIFNDCVYVRFLLLNIGGSDTTDVSTGDVRDHWAETTEILADSSRKQGLILLAATWWVIWTDRNNSVFRGNPPNVTWSLERVKQLISNWTTML